MNSSPPRVGRVAPPPPGAPLVALAAALSVASTTAPPPAFAADGANACGARLQGRFVESAPRDRFEFAHRSTAGWTITRLALDLGGSAGRLLFDTEDGGEGVEVFQPFRAEAGAVSVREVRLPGDGDARIELDFGAAGADGNASDGAGPDAASSGAFGAGETFVFSIDVDDRLPASELGQIRVSGAEIEGGRLSVDFVHGDGVLETLVGYFEANASIELVGTPCRG